MPELETAQKPGPDEPSTPSRLRRTRKFSHGLSQPPRVKHCEPRGDAALLPCPRSVEGKCVYKRTYRCRDEIRDYSIANGGVCAIEEGVTAHYVKSILEMLDCGRESDGPGERLMDAVRALAESMTYMTRAQRYVGMLQTREVKGPQDPVAHHRAMMRAITYQALGVSAWLRRQNDVVAHRLWELGFHPDRMREDLEKDGVSLYNWWVTVRREAAGRPFAEFLWGFRRGLPDGWTRTYGEVA